MLKTTLICKPARRVRVGECLFFSEEMAAIMPTWGNKQLVPGAYEVREIKHHTEHSRTFFLHVADPRLVRQPDTPYRPVIEVERGFLLLRVRGDLITWTVEEHP